MEKNVKPNELTLEEFFVLLFRNFTKYIDYFEADLGEFLNIKLFKRYYFYIVSRISIIIVYLSTTTLFMFIEASLIRTICGIISICLFIAFCFIDKFIYNKYKYTSSFFQGKRRILLIFRNQLNLLLNNSYLPENYERDKFELINSKANKIKNRIDNDAGIIHPYSYYLKKFALSSILFTPIITFIISILLSLIQNPIMLDKSEISRFFLGLLPFSFLLYQVIRSIVGIKQSRKSQEGSIYLFLEGMIFIFLEIIRLKIRIIQFPKEEKLKEKLLNLMKEIVNKNKKI